MNKSAVLIIGGIAGFLRKTGASNFMISQVESLEDAAHIVSSGQKFNLVLLAVTSEMQDPIPFVRDLMARDASAKVMFFSSRDELHAALAWLADLAPENLRRLIRSEPLRPEIQTSKSGISGSEFDGLIGESAEMEKLKKLVLKIAPTGTTILLQGESGTGKEVLARSIHKNSSRSSEAFIPVDCAAISGNIIESELFGHAKGSFTGADRSTLGMIRSADKGTLFLDEIGELPMNMQAKLLRTLQERVVKPVGESRIYPVNIRIIAATNRNLAEAVKNGEFREDLYYRLNAITIYAAPLRERSSDVPLICRHILDRLEDEGFPRKRISERAMASLSAYRWPGNVRELENVVRRAAMLTGGDIIDNDSISFESGQMLLAMDEVEENNSSVVFHEKEAIVKALKKTSGNRRATAELLGISEATLYRRLKTYCL
jgi:transcriptional regulator with PAS, ATPase and Fis domain